MVICLERGADCMHMVQLMPVPRHAKIPSSLAAFKFRLGLPFWYRLTQVVLEKRPLNGCSSCCGCSSGGGGGSDPMCVHVSGWSDWTTWHRSSRANVTTTSSGQVARTTC